MTAKIDDAQAAKSADKSARSAWASSIAALISAGVAVPGAILSYHQLTEINESARSAADSLLQAKAAVAEAKRIADGVDRTADATYRVAEGTDQQAKQMARLADRTDRQQQEIAGARRATEDMARTAENQLSFAARAQENTRRPKLLITSVSFTTLQEGKRTHVEIETRNKGLEDPDDVDLWTTIVAVPVSQQLYKRSPPLCGHGTGGVITTYGRGSYTSDAKVPLTKELAKMLDGGTAALVAYGRICYSDGTGAPKMVTYCAASGSAGTGGGFCAK